MNKKINIEDALSFAHERIDRVTNENLELRLLVNALLFSHPNLEQLASSIEQEKEIFLSMGAPSNISDESLSYVRKKALRAIELVLAQSQSAE